MQPPSDTPQGPGSIRLAAAISQILANTLVAVRHHTHQLDIEQDVAAREMYHERYEPTLISAFRPMLDQLADHPGAHPALANVADDMRSGRGQIQGAMLGFAIPFLIAEGLSPVLEPFSQGLKNESWAKLLGAAASFSGVPLSSTQLADIVVKGILEQDAAAELAKLSGTTPTDFDLMVKDTGEAPSPQELLTAYRRGFINQARLEHGIRQGHTKDEWIDVFEQLRFTPLPPAEAVAAAVQGHLTDAESRQKWQEGGMEPGDYDAAYATAGRPPGPSQLLELYNRGIITQDEFVAAVRESDIKDKYIDLLLQLGQYLPPPRTVTTLLKENAITHDQALSLLGDYGVTSTDAEAYIKGATAQKLKTTKTLAISLVEQLYHDHLLDRGQAAQAIETLGYSPHDADFILTVQDLKREQGYAEKAITAVHTQYVGHHIDETTAKQILDELGVTADAVAHLLTIWTHEIQAHVRVLTPAQVVAAVKLTFISNDQAVARLQALGYSEDDAKLVLDIGLKSAVVPLPPPV